MNNAKYAGKAPAAAPTHRSWVMAAVVAVIMVLLAFVGVGLTTGSSPATAKSFWTALVPVYGLLCVATAWKRNWHDRGFDKGMVVRQLFHWLGIAGALALDFLIRSAGVESAEATGFTALLLLALGCFLAGVHLDWLFVPVGLLLAATYVVAAKAMEYLWLFFVIGVAVVVLALAGRWLMARYQARKHKAAPAPAAGSASS